MRYLIPLVLTWAALLTAPALARQDLDDDLPPQPEGVEVLTRGPVHEAFAGPLAFDPQPSPVVPKAPPEPIEEMPPEQKPEGDNVTWIGGYWAWDDERDDFLWISGIWRDIPPGRQWVPGYWEEVDGGFQWVRGYWLSETVEEVSYLPEPPSSLEEGPNSPAPSQEHAWAPGHWNWAEDRYLWRPGYWFVVRPNWVWVPAHYIWTPAGCVFVAGYWDYVVEQRGLLFAPVYVPPAVVQQQFVYVPNVVIPQTALADHFWVRPTYGQYYFGDYYDPAYQQAGFNYWAAAQPAAAVYDPIFTQRSVVLAQQGPGWLDQARQAYRLRVADEAARPPRTFAAQRALLAQRDDVPAALRIAAPLAALGSGRADRAFASRLRLERINDERRQELARRVASLREFQRERRQQEARLTAELRDTRAERTRDAQVKAAQAKVERLEDAREKAARKKSPADRADRREAAREQAQQPGAARALRLPRSPVAAQAPRGDTAKRAGAAAPPPDPTPRSDRPSTDAPKAARPRPDLPKRDRPEPGVTKTERLRPPLPADLPKRDRPEPPKADRPNRPDGLPPGLPGAGRRDQPKANPPQSRPDSPARKADRPDPGATKTERMRPPLPPGRGAGRPDLDRPKQRPPAGNDRQPETGPRPERPRPMPKATPPPDRPKAQPRPEPPKAQPRLEPPKAQPRPEPPPVPKAAPRPDPGGDAQPKGKAQGKRKQSD